MVEHNWLLYIAAFACAFAITLVTTPFAKWLSVKCGAIDYPKDRGVHKKPMPRMGGVAIVLGFTITVLMVNYFDKSMDSRQFAGFLVGALLIAGLGVVDDMKNLPAKLKFCVQILAALIVIFSGTRIQVVLWPVTAYLQKFSIPITLVWIVGVTNAVNLIDGLDGLAVGVSSIAAITMLAVALLTGNMPIAITMAALAGACIGFMPYNLNPAKIFMGDTGSTFLGYILATYSIQGLFKYYAIVSFAVPFLVLGLPIFDTAFAIVRRVARGQSPMTPDRGHIHHRMMDMGLNQKQTVAALYVVSSLLGLSAVVLTTSGELKAMLLLLTLAAVAYVASRVIFPREIAETAHEKELEQEEMQAKSAAPAPEEKEEKHEED